MIDQLEPVLKKLADLGEDPVLAFVVAHMDDLDDYLSLRAGAQEHAGNRELIAEIQKLKQEIALAKDSEGRSGFYSKAAPSSLMEFRLSELQKNLYGSIDAKFTDLLEEIQDLRHLLRDLDISVSTNMLWQVIEYRMEDARAMRLADLIRARGETDLGKLIDAFIGQYGEQYLSHVPTFVRFLILSGIAHPADIVDMIVDRYEKG